MCSSLFVTVHVIQTLPIQNKNTEETNMMSCDVEFFGLCSIPLKYRTYKSRCYPEKLDSVHVTFDRQAKACTQLNNAALVKDSKLVHFNYVYCDCVKGLRQKENITHPRWLGFYTSNIHGLDTTRKKFRRKSLSHFQIGGKE